MDDDDVHNLAVILEEIVMMRTDDLVDAIVKDVVLAKPVDVAKRLASRVDSPSLRLECLVFVWWIVDLLLFQEIGAAGSEALAVALTERLLDSLEDRGFVPEERAELDRVRKARFLQYGSFAHQGGAEGAQGLSFAAWQHIIGEDLKDIRGPAALVGVAAQIMDSLRPLIRKLRAV